jgi:hypothetical protein
LLHLSLSTYRQHRDNLGVEDYRNKQKRQPFS